MLSTFVTDGNCRIITLSPKTEDGKPAILDGPAQFSSADPTVIGIEALEGGTSVKVFSPDGVTPVHDVPVLITVTADADLGKGVRPIQEQFEVTAVGEAAGLGLSVGELQPK